MSQRTARSLAATVLLFTALCGTSPAAPPPDNYTVTKIRLHLRPNHAARLKGGRFAGSLTSPTNDFHTLIDLKEAPADNQWTELTLPPNTPAFRYLKWEGPPNSFASIAEIEFYHHDRKLTGTPFATTGAKDNPNNNPALAFDNNPQTFFDGANPNFQYVGLDLGPQSQTAAPKLSIPSGQYPTPQTVALSTDTPDATIRYSLTAGSPRNVYSKSITISQSTVLQAVATKPGLADSTPTLAAYRIGQPDPNAKDIASFHIGNSLTDTVNPWMTPLSQSAGHNLRYYRFTIPGAPTDWLWSHPGSGFGESWYEQAFLARAPLTHLVTQPFAGHNRSVQNEAQHSGLFYDLARQHSPNLQHWLYVQWPSKRMDDNWSKGKVAVEQNGQYRQIDLAPPATTWQEAVHNHVKYVELVKQEMDQSRAADIKAGKAKPVLIIPAGLALAALKTEIDAGRIPGQSDFFADTFSDDLHLSPRGAYLVSLVHYACFFQQSPEGQVTTANSTLTDAQARLYQRLAWQTTQSYPLSRLPHPSPR